MDVGSDFDGGVLDQEDALQPTFYELLRRMTMAKPMHKDETGLDSLDPSTANARDGSRFRAIIAARKAVDG